MPRQSPPQPKEKPSGVVAETGSLALPGTLEKLRSVTVTEVPEAAATEAPEAAAPGPGQEGSLLSAKRRGLTDSQESFFRKLDKKVDSAPSNVETPPCIDGKTPPEASAGLEQGVVQR